MKVNGIPSTSAYSGVSSGSASNGVGREAVIRHAPQRPADHLLAQKLRAERPHAEDVRDRAASQPSVSMETDTTQRTCSPSRPAWPTVFITSRSRSASVSVSASVVLAAHPQVALEHLDLWRGQLAELVDSASPDLEFLAVDQDRVRPVQQAPLLRCAGPRRWRTA